MKYKLVIEFMPPQHVKIGLHFVKHKTDIKPMRDLTGIYLKKRYLGWNSDIY